MANLYNLDGIVTELKKRNAQDRAILAAWEAVTYPTKKDGKPFARMAQNISGAKYAAEAYTLQPGEMKITVTTWGADYGVGYVSDDLNAYTTADRMTDAQQGKPGNLLPKVPGLKQIYLFDLDDIKAAIAARCDQLREWIATRENQIKQAHAAYSTFYAAYGAALDQLAAMTSKDFGGATLYHAILDTVTARYPHC